MNDQFARQTLPEDASLSTQWPAQGGPLITFTSPATGAFDDNVMVFDEIKKLDKTAAEFIEHPENHRTSTLTHRHYSDTPDFPTTILSVRRPDHIVMGIVGDTPLTEVQMKIITLMHEIKGRTTVIIRGATHQEVVDKMIAEQALTEIKDVPVLSAGIDRLTNSEYFRRRDERRTLLVGDGPRRSLAIAAAIAAMNNVAAAAAPEPDLAIDRSYWKHGKGQPLPKHHQLLKGGRKPRRW